jgi:hypothetical protein
MEVWQLAEQGCIGLGKRLILSRKRRLPLFEPRPKQRKNRRHLIVDDMRESWQI